MLCRDFEFNHERTEAMNSTIQPLINARRAYLATIAASEPGTPEHTKATYHLGLVDEWLADIEQESNG